MAFYTLSENQFTRHHREEIEMAFSAMDCVLCGERAVYASTELTTGTRLYQTLERLGGRTKAELRDRIGPDWFTSHVWDPNVEAAAQFANEVRRAHEYRVPVITPAPFSAPGWTQPEYLTFWETLLRTRIREVWFNANWQFSNGCTFEFAVARDAGLPTRDHQGQPLEIDVAVDLIRTSIRTLEASGFETNSLRENLHRILAVHSVESAR